MFIEFYKICTILFPTLSVLAVLFVYCLMIGVWIRAEIRNNGFINDKKVGFSDVLFLTVMALFIAFIAASAMAVFWPVLVPIILLYLIVKYMRYRKEPGGVIGALKRKGYL